MSALTRSPTLVELKFDHLPDRTYQGFIEKISRRDLDFVPELLSNKLGGEVATAAGARSWRTPLKKALARTSLEKKSNFLTFSTFPKFQRFWTFLFW